MAVAVFWCGFSSGWAALLAYHVQILLWTIHKRPGLKTPSQNKTFFWALPFILAGPVLYLLLPYVTHSSLSDWLASHHLSRLSLYIMVPYFGTIHTFLEQVHWSTLRGETSTAHFFFAGYHMLVLYSLLSLPWLIICFTVLVASSFLWDYLYRRSGSIIVPFISHALADTGVIIVALLKTRT